MQRQSRLLGKRPLAPARRPSRAPALLGLTLVLALAGAPGADAAALRADGTAPTVTLDPVALCSSDAMPAFSGTASDTTPVTVSVYEGTGAEGEPVAIVHAAVKAGRWRSPSVSPPLGARTYTAVASEPSSLGGAPGTSGEVSFEVNPRAPALTLSAPPSRSRDASPSFSGTSSEAGEVTVEVFEGTRPAGPLAAVAKARVTGGGWSSEPVTLPQGRHTFTAVAVQPATEGNVAGRSAPATFVVDTEPPTVTLAAPPTPSNRTAPSFSGTSSEAGEVLIEVYAGASATGAPVATATAEAPAGGGAWTSGGAKPALSDGTFTAVATQQSSIGNAAGSSAPVTFVVDTAPPAVTLNAPLSPSGDRVPSFSGTASDRTPVIVEVYAGTRAEGAPVATATAEVAGGRWVSAKVSPALSFGEYTAVATQSSSIVGNPSGTSAPVRFSVQPIPPAAATEAASSVTRTSAALYGLVDPSGAGVSSCYFEYGPTPAYGKSIECGFVSEAGAFPEAATVAVPVFVRIYGLSPATTYHFRLVAVGEGGSAYGADETFTTQPPWQSGEAGRGGVSASRSQAAGEVAALIARALTPRGRAARIAAVLRSGGSKAAIKLTQAGAAVLDWYYIPRATRRGGRAAHSSLLVASGALGFQADHTASLNVRLTSAGRRLLGGARRARLTATCVFTPVQGSAGGSSASFELRR
jgi:hypothetical protein